MVVLPADPPLVPPLLPIVVELAEVYDETFLNLRLVYPLEEGVLSLEVLLVLPFILEPAFAVPGITFKFKLAMNSS